ncbi:hypothetical protein KIPB_001360, partial [Kipferlia bialata]
LFSGRSLRILFTYSVGSLIGLTYDILFVARMAALGKLVPKDHRNTKTFLLVSCVTISSLHLLVRTLDSVFSPNAIDEVYSFGARYLTMLTCRIVAVVFELVILVHMRARGHEGMERLEEEEGEWPLAIEASVTAVPGIQSRGSSFCTFNSFVTPDDTDTDGGDGEAEAEPEGVQTRARGRGPGSGRRPPSPSATESVSDVSDPEVLSTARGVPSHSGVGTVPVSPAESRDRGRGRGVGRETEDREDTEAAAVLLRSKKLVGYSLFWLCIALLMTAFEVLDHHVVHHLSEVNEVLTAHGELTCDVITGQVGVEKCSTLPNVFRLIDKETYILLRYVWILCSRISSTIKAGMVPPRVGLNMARSVTMSRITPAFSSDNPLPAVPFHLEFEPSKLRDSERTVQTLRHPMGKTYFDMDEPSVASFEAAHLTPEERALMPPHIVHSPGIVSELQQTEDPAQTTPEASEAKRERLTAGVVDLCRLYVAEPQQGTSAMSQELFETKVFELCGINGFPVHTIKRMVQCCAKALDSVACALEKCPRLLPVLRVGATQTHGDSLRDHEVMATARAGDLALTALCTGLAVAQSMSVGTAAMMPCLAVPDELEVTLLRHHRMLLWGKANASEIEFTNVIN